MQLDLLGESSMHMYAPRHQGHENKSLARAYVYFSAFQGPGDKEEEVASRHGPSCRLIRSMVFNILQLFARPLSRTLVWHWRRLTLEDLEDVSKVAVLQEIERFSFHSDTVLLCCRATLWRRPPCFSCAR